MGGARSARFTRIYEFIRDTGIHSFSTDQCVARAFGALAEKLGELEAGGGPACAPADKARMIVDLRCIMGRVPESRIASGTAIMAPAAPAAADPAPDMPEAAAAPAGFALLEVD
jgi:hypothetical protein